MFRLRFLFVCSAGYGESVLARPFYWIGRTKEKQKKNKRRTKEGQKKDGRKTKGKRETKERQRKKDCCSLTSPTLLFPKIASFMDAWCWRLSTAAVRLTSFNPEMRSKTALLLASQFGRYLVQTCVRIVEVRSGIARCQCCCALSTEGGSLHSQTYTVTAGEPNLHSGRALLSVNASSSSSSASAPDWVTIL